MNLTARQATEYIYKKEGLPGFMRGFVPSMYKNFWNAGTYFSVLYYLEEVIRGSGFFSESQVFLLASAGARTIQTVTINPLVVVKTRFEVIGFSEYSNMADGFKQIIMKEGASGLTAGLKISLIRDVPFSGVFYPIYNFFKMYYAMILGFDLEQQAGGQNNRERLFNLTVVAALASFSANAASCAFTNPLDLIRTRAYF